MAIHFSNSLERNNCFSAGPDKQFRIKSIRNKDGIVINFDDIRDPKERELLLKKYGEFAKKILRKVEKENAASTAKTIVATSEAIDIRDGSQQKRTLSVSDHYKKVLNKAFADNKKVTAIFRRSQEAASKPATPTLATASPIDFWEKEYANRDKNIGAVNGIQTWKTPTTLIKEFSEGAYNLASIETFKERLSLTYDAAIDRFPNLQAQIDALEQESLKECDYLLKKHNTNQNEFQEKVKKIDTEFYKPLHKDGLNVCAQFFADVEHFIHQTDPSFDLGTAEKDYIAKTPRPWVLHVYTVQRGKFFSAQTPYNSTPSTKREGSALPNYVQTYHGTINDQGQFTTTYHGIRHSSYPPIDLRKGLIANAKDPSYVAAKCKARATANKFVGEVFKDLTDRILQGNPSATGTQDQPLRVPLRTMMLFTPAMMDRIKRKSDSEVSQMRDSIFALKSYASRPHPIEIAGKVIWIQPDIQIMNFGANKETTYFPLHKTYINKASFTAFQEEAIHSAQLKDISHPLWNHFKTVFLSKSTQAATLSQELQKLYQKLDTKYQQLNQTPDNKSLHGGIARLSEQINKQEAAIEAENKRIISYQKEQFMLMKNRGDLKQLLDAFPKNSFLQVFLETQELYYTEAFLKIEHVMDLQCRYLQLQHLMGNFTEFFCKSGEDRTGAIDDKIQSLNTFFAIHKHYPRLSDPEDTELMKPIELAVHQASASQANTFYNSRARGLQLSPDVCPSNFPAKIEDMQAKLAKKVVKKGRELTPSKSFPSGDSPIYDKALPVNDKPPPENPQSSNTYSQMPPRRPSFKKIRSPYNEQPQVIDTSITKKKTSKTKKKPPLIKYTKLIISKFNETNALLYFKAGFNLLAAMKTALNKIKALQQQRPRDKKTTEQIVGNFQKLAKSLLPSPKPQNQEPYERTVATPEEVAKSTAYEPFPLEASIKENTTHENDNSAQLHNQGDNTSPGTAGNTSTLTLEAVVSSTPLSARLKGTADETLNYCKSLEDRLKGFSAVLAEMQTIIKKRRPWQRRLKNADEINARLSQALAKVNDANQKNDLFQKNIEPFSTEITTTDQIQNLCSAVTSQAFLKLLESLTPIHSLISFLIEPDNKDLLDTFGKKTPLQSGVLKSFPDLKSAMMTYPPGLCAQNLMRFKDLIVAFNEQLKKEQLPPIDLIETKIFSILKQANRSYARRGTIIEDATVGKYDLNFLTDLQIKQGFFKNVYSIEFKNKKQKDIFKIANNNRKPRLFIIYQDETKKGLMFEYNGPDTVEDAIKKLQNYYSRP